MGRALALVVRRARRGLGLLEAAVVRGQEENHGLKCTESASSSRRQRPSVARASAAPTVGLELPACASQVLVSGMSEHRSGDERGRRHRVRSLVGFLAGVVAVALGLALVWPMWTQPGRWQWDFRVYYLAANAHAIGLDPYDTRALGQLSGVPQTLPFVYPPHVLWLMRPFTSVPYDSAARAYLALKTAAGVGLIALLARAFLADGRDALFWVFSLAAFKGALWLDMRAGNVVVFEQLALWGAFYFFVRDRLAAFCSLVLVAASFKLAPALFLSLLLFVKHPTAVAISPSAAPASDCSCSPKPRSPPKRCTDSSETR